MTSLKARCLNSARVLGVGSALVVALWLTTAIAAPAQTFNSLVSFDGTNGMAPNFMSLVQGRDGNFYGTTNYGGANTYACGGSNGCGTVFKITPGGKLTTLYSFCSQTGCADGANPQAGLVQATDGNLYGTTFAGGAGGGFGTFFKITPAGKLTTLYTFYGFPAGADPRGTLVQATNGNFYGTTYNYSTVFEITAAGKFTTLYTFCSQPGCTDGYQPYAGLVQATNGNFYGTTYFGGAYGFGTVFKITPAGALTTLHSFGGSDGANPYGGLAQATDGNLYGTTAYVGANGSGGTVFKITPSGNLTTLYSFCSQTNCTDGSQPLAGLVQATDGNLYGTTFLGGANTYGCTSNGNYVGCGTVFKITPKGKLTTLYSFCPQSGCTDGEMPYVDGVFQATNGTFYGTTYEGGDLSCNAPNGCGTLYSLSMGLGPFVSFVRSSGKVGSNVQILGQGFTGTSGVSFNGTPASYTVKRDTYLVATVPQGATTGYVTVTTPSGTLQSNVIFRVRP